MKIDNANIIGELERFAAACPWNRVDIWVCRAPEGAYSFLAYVNSNEKYGLRSGSAFGPTPQAAVDAVLKTYQSDPNFARLKEIERLKEQIARLEQVVICLPPYRPGRELGSGEAYIEAPETVEV